MIRPFDFYMEYLDYTEYNQSLRDDHEDEFFVDDRLEHLR